MKYIKLYENIDFDDISDEEFEFDNILNDIHIKPGDILLPQLTTFWDNNKWENYNYNYNYDDNKYIIDKIELSDNITGNPYNNYNQLFKKIPNNEIMFSVKKFPYWFKYNKNLKIQ